MLYYLAYLLNGIVISNFIVENMCKRFAVQPLYKSFGAYAVPIG